MAGGTGLTLCINANLMTSYRRKLKKWLYGSCPGFRGSFPYYGTRIYFPPNSLIFRLACDHGIYEAVNQRALVSSLRDGATVFDVGANIGLLSAPLLALNNSIKVLSIEPSPTTYDCLERSVAASRWVDRWSAISTAIGDHVGTISFFCADPSLGAFDGVRDTRRAGNTTKIEVPLTTVDQLWLDKGSPEVCAIKIDVEGAEASALRGAARCVQASRPMLLVEWNAVNLASFACPPETLLTIANDFGYEVFAMPGLVPMISPSQLRTYMAFDESFVLLPQA